MEFLRWWTRMDATKLLLDHGRHDVVLAMFGVQNVLMSRPAIFDRDVVDFPF